MTIDDKTLARLEKPGVTLIGHGATVDDVMAAVKRLKGLGHAIDASVVTREGKFLEAQVWHHLGCRGCAT